MLCRCGNEISNVPEHLRDLASWICEKCTNTAPKGVSLTIDIEPPKRSFPRRPKKQAA